MVQSIKFIKNGPQAQNTSLKAQNKHQPEGPRQTPAQRPMTNTSPSPSPAQLTSARRIPRGDSPAQQVDWPDRTIGLGPDWTGLICKQSGPKFWDRTVVRSHGPVQSKLSNCLVYIFWTGLFTVYKKFGTGLLTVRSFISRLNISVRS